MVSIAAFAETASLVGDPTRASMLEALLDGRALTASELARAAGITPQTASAHLARLTTAGLLTLERQGRHHYHRLASAEVAQMLEGIMVVAGADDAARKRRPVFVGPRDAALRAARTCYDHFAGRLGVGLADALVAGGYVELSPEGGAVTREGAALLARLRIELDGAKRGRAFCRPCLDWSERRPHIAGAVGAALCRHAFARHWVRRIDGTRALTVTPEGLRSFRDAFGVELSPLRLSA
jgi:DNA-binding transcriptional ArsR family regulator